MDTAIKRNDRQTYGEDRLMKKNILITESLTDRQTKKIWQLNDRDTETVTGFCDLK